MVTDKSELSTSSESDLTNCEASVFPFYLPPKFFLDDVIDQIPHQLYGEFGQLKQFKSPYLVPLIELVRSRHGRMFIVTSSLPSNNLADQLNQYQPIESHLNEIINLIVSIIRGFEDLKRFNISHGFLSPEQIYLNENDNGVIISGYWWNILSKFGTKTPFPLINLSYASPEIIAYYLNLSLCKIQNQSLKNQESFSYPPFDHQSDVWSIGAILFTLISGKNVFDVDQPLSKQTLSIGMKLFLKDESTVKEFNQRIENTFQSIEQNFQDDSGILQQLFEFIRSCLNIDASQRLSIDALKTHSLITQHKTHLKRSKCWDSYPILPSVNLTHQSLQLPPDQYFHLWKLAGGDLDSLIKYSLPPIMTLPQLVSNTSNTSNNNSQDPTLLFNANNPIRLNLSQLIQRKSELIPQLTQHPIYLEDSETSMNIKEPIYDHSIPSYMTPMSSQKDFNFNFTRLQLFQNLLNQYPVSKDEIEYQAKLGIPSQVRGKVWACLLGVEFGELVEYDKIDKDMPLTTDRQLQMDIIRCHQHHPLLGSPTGHKKLKALLKAWQVNNSHLVYWQGVDSLAAMFLSCNFDDEPLALASLQRFIAGYQPKFFTENNSKELWGYLGVFLQLLTFHDPHLAHHLHRLGLGPKAYAINWFYTMFAYVFPLDTVVLLWDRILTNPPTYPWMVGLAILNQLRDQILTSEQLGTIPLSTDAFLDVDLEICLGKADVYYEMTPDSLLDVALFNQVNPPSQISWDFPEEITHIPSIDIRDWGKFQQQAFAMDLRSKSTFQARHLKGSFHLDRPAHLLKVVANALRPYSEQRIMGLMCDDIQAGAGFVSGLIRNQFPHLIRITGWAEVQDVLIDISEGDGVLRTEWCHCGGTPAYHTQPKYRDNPNVLLSKCVHLPSI